MNRRNIVALAFAFLSATTALCGAALSVTSLALARIGVGIGESAGSPASQSWWRRSPSFLVGCHLGPIFAIAQTVVKPSMRALASALIALTATCFGQGVGPLAVGMINDALKGTYGVDSVRYSLLSAAVTTTLGALLFVWAARSIRADIARAAA